MNSQNNKILVVLGMHRSGTSAIARSLAALGVNLGSRLIAPMPDNPKGFWEDADILDLNESLLGVLGSHHLSLAPIQDVDWNASTLETLKFRAIQTLREKLELYGPVYGIKDPRFAKLLPFWRHVFQEAELNVYFIIACRNPLSIAHSLRVRNGTHAVKSWYLWFEHMLRSLTETEGYPRIVVDYDRLIDAPNEQLQRMAHWFALPFDATSQSFIDFRDRFLDNSLRHTVFSLEDLKHAEPVPPNTVISLYALLRDLSVDRKGLDQIETIEELDRLSKAWEDMIPLLRYIDHMDSNDERNLSETANLILQLFFSEQINGQDQDYSELRSIRQQYALDGESKSIDLVFPLDCQPLSKLRLDIASAPAAITVGSIALYFPDGSEIWRWSGEVDLFSEQADMTCLKTDEDVIVLSLSDDPRCELAIPHEVLSQVSGGCFLRIVLTAKPLLKALPEVLSKVRTQMSALESFSVCHPATVEHQALLTTLPFMICEFIEVAQLMKTVLTRRNETIANQRAELEALRARQNVLEAHVQRAEAQLDVLKEFVLAAFGKSTERI